MKREEFLIGAAIYALIIAAGFSGPILKKLDEFPWEKPVGSFLWSSFQPPVPIIKQEAKKTILLSKFRKVLTADGHSSTSTVILDAVHQKLKENWEKVDAQPSVSDVGAKPSKIAQPIFGGKTGMKMTPVIPERSVPHGDEPSRG